MEIYLLAAIRLSDAEHKGSFAYIIYVLGCDLIFNKPKLFPYCGPPNIAENFRHVLG
jgi:hypothetical protein